MRKHMVVCVECGRQFDANWGGYYDSKSRRYTCKSCYRKKYGKGKSGWFKANWKIVIGIMFLIAFVGYLQDSTIPVEETVFALVGGIGLLAWHFLPNFLEKRRAIKESEEARERDLNTPKICPRCGATTKGENCEYCGSKL